MPKIFGSHMVLQRDQQLPVWGHARPGAVVTLSFRSKRYEAKADMKGRWHTTLPKMEAGGPYRLSVESAKSPSLVFEDILIGEVWICSGQSNMEFPLSRAQEAKSEIASAKDSRLRLFTVPRKASQVPLDDCDGKWQACTSESAKGFSAVAYFFGRELRSRLREVPVGLVKIAWGGSSAETWTSPMALKKEKKLARMLAGWKETDRSYAKRMKAHKKRIAAWSLAAKKAKRAGKKPPRRPRPPMGPQFKNHPSNLYRGMLLPIVPYAMRGVIWYQGENNASRAAEYYTLFPLLIRDWRNTWAKGPFGLLRAKPRTFPFYFVQLAGFKVRNPRSWADLRDAQLATLSVPDTGMAVAIDIGEPRNIHPKNKQEVGRRLALLARHRVYGEDVEDSGPVLVTMKRDRGGFFLNFRHATKGLCTDAKAGSKTPLRGFELAGKDRRFVKATAVIEGQGVYVRADAVKHPVAVRYAYTDFPDANLYNGVGLPASPFRSDDWPAPGQKKRR